MTPSLEVRQLHVQFPRAPRDAVNGVDLTIHAEEIVALVGESGSGKTLTALSIGRLLPTTACWRAASIQFKHRDLLTLPDREFRHLLGQEVAYVFQDPASSLNPVLTVGEQLCEPLIVHRGMRWSEARTRAMELLAAVQLADPAETLPLYPHQLSGGMQQRVMLAMAALLNPALLIADEPTTALDATVQVQILALLLALRRQQGMAILLITHDLLHVAPIADRVAVMSQGRIVETAPTTQLYQSPQHPHTRALLSAMPRMGQGRLTHRTS